jgi:hypothetical protein
MTTPLRRVSSRRLGVLAAGVAALALTLSACSSSSDSGGSSGSVDCAAATSAIEVYSTALTDMVIGLSEDDADAARAGAEAFGPAALDVTRALPGLPAEAEDFVTRSEDASRLVTESLADDVASDVILDELDTLFSSEEFTSAGNAIDEVYSASCPNSTPAP